jgi:hypothetical protein
MDDANIETLVEKVTTVALGPHAYLLSKLVDLLYERTQEPESFPPGDLAVIEESLAQLERRIMGSM